MLNFLNVYIVKTLIKAKNNDNNNNNNNNNNTVPLFWKKNLFHNKSTVRSYHMYFLYEFVSFSNLEEAQEPTHGE